MLGLVWSSGHARGKARKPTGPARTHANVAYGNDERNVLDFWQAEGVGPRPLLIYIHGGGWMKGDKRAMKNAGEYLKEGISVASINYRLVPKHPLPTPVHDAARAVQFLRFKRLDHWDQNHVMGHGFVFLIAARLGVEMPEAELDFYNRGQGGARFRAFVSAGRKMR